MTDTADRVNKAIAEQLAIDPERVPLDPDEVTHKIRKALTERGIVPERLPAAVQNTAVGSLVKVESGTRRTYGFLATPELVREFGGIGRVGEAGGRPVADWGTHVAAARHLAESLASMSTLRAKKSCE